VRGWRGSITKLDTGGAGWFGEVDAKMAHSSQNISEREKNTMETGIRWEQRGWFLVKWGKLGGGKGEVMGLREVKGRGGKSCPGAHLKQQGGKGKREDFNQKKARKRFVGG